MATMKTVHGNTYDEAGVLAAQAILGTGIRVALTKDSNRSGGKGKSGGAQEEYGALKFTADLKFEAKKPKPRFSTTYLSSIRDVDLRQEATGQYRDVCRIEMKEDAPSPSFCFVSADPVGQFSTSEITRFVANYLKRKVDQLHQINILGQTRRIGARRRSTDSVAGNPRSSTYSVAGNPRSTRSGNLGIFGLGGGVFLGGARAGF